MMMEMVPRMAAENNCDVRVIGFSHRRMRFSYELDDHFPQSVFENSNVKFGMVMSKTSRKNTGANNRIDHIVPNHKGQ